MSRRQEMILGTMGVIDKRAAQGARFVEFELKCVCFHRSHYYPLIPVDAMLCTNERWKTRNRSNTGMVIIVA